jgi:acyl carrier protein
LEDHLRIQTKVAQRFCDFSEWGIIRNSLKEQLRLPDWELERIGDKLVGDSLDLVEATMALEESFKIKIPL